MTIEIRPNQILVSLSAAHLERCHQWQQQIETEWLQAQQQQQASQSPDAQQLPIPRRGGAIGGAFTYTIRPTSDGYRLSVHDAISRGERDWTASGGCADLAVFATLHEREYELLIDWFTQFENEDTTNDKQSRLAISDRDDRVTSTYNEPSAN